MSENLNGGRRLSGKVAIVTGASKGIGAGIAEKLAAEGASVAVNYNSDQAGANAVVNRIVERGGAAIAVQADVADSAQVKLLVEQTVSKFGRLDVMVNNAGIFSFAPLSELTEESYDKHFNINVKGLLFGAKYAAEAFGTGGGKIINISSVVAAMPPAGSSVYSATKGAVDTITRALAVELGGRNILVNSISPGATETEGTAVLGAPEEFNQLLIAHTALGRMGKPSDIADAVAFFASDDANWITGQVLHVSGGIRM